MVSVAVQPPSQTSINTQFYPPLVAKTRLDRTPEDEDYSYVFATAVLLDHNGHVLEGQLHGNTLLSTATKVMDPGRGGASSSSGQPSLYFTFPDLFVTSPGTYTIRIDVYVTDYEDPQGAQLIQQTETRQFTVYEDDVAVEKPCANPKTHHDELLQVANHPWLL